MERPEELEKVCRNLRSVTQSCKGGVLFNRLEYDYKALLGTDIPYKRMGYDSLEAFILSLPTVVRLKIVQGKKTVEAVADQTTAHIASMISKQKSSKSGLGMKPVKKSVPYKKPIPGKIQVSVKNPVPAMKPVLGNKTAPVKEQPKTSNVPWRKAPPIPPKATTSTNGLTVPSHNLSIANLKSIVDYSLPIVSPFFEQKLESISNSSDLCNGTDDGTESLNGISQSGSEYCMEDPCSDGSSWEIAKGSRRPKSSYADIIKQQNSSDKGISGKVDIPSSSQNSAKKAYLNPMTEELKKAVCINLRGITISSKTGVLVQNLQKDYQQFIGSQVPFDILGYENLESFLESIPDVINLVRNECGQLVAEAVPNSSTAHISKLISKQKSDKNVKQMKKSYKFIPKKVPKTLKHTSVQVGPTLKQKEVQVVQQVRDRYVQTSLPNIVDFQDQMSVQVVQVPQTTLKDQSVQVGQKCKDKFVQATHSTMNENISVSDVSSSTSRASPHTPELSEISETYDSDIKFQSSIGSTVKSMGSFSCIRENIENTNFNTLMGLHNLLFGVSYVDTLKKKILDFGGHFSLNSDEWKQKEFLLSVLPLDGLKEYLNLLCVRFCDTDDKHILLKKFMNFISSLETDLVDPKKVGKISSDEDWYKKSQAKDEKLAEVMNENKKLKAELKKLKLFWCKKSEAKVEKMGEIMDEYNKFKTELQILQSESKSYEKLLMKAAKREQDLSKKLEKYKDKVENLQIQKSETDTKIQKMKKEKGQLEFQLNSIKHEMKVMDKQRKDLVNYLSTFSTQHEKMKNVFLTELNSVSDTLCSLVDSFDQKNNSTLEMKTVQNKLTTQTNKLISLEQKLKNLQIS